MIQIEANKGYNKDKSKNSHHCQTNWISIFTKFKVHHTTINKIQRVSNRSVNETLIRELTSKCQPISLFK